MPNEYYYENGFRIFIVNEKVMKKYERKSNIENFPTFYKFYEKVRTFGTIIKEFDGGNKNKNGKIIIFKLGENEA